MLDAAAPSIPAPPAYGELGEAALAYARHGFSVFPCVPREKRPLTRIGLLAATRDPVLIAAWWSKVPHANIGLACGPDLVALDIDVKRGSQGIPSFLRYLSTYGSTLRELVDGGARIVLTPSGGFHIWLTDWRGREAPPSRNPLVGFPGMEVKSSGTYVCAPPSCIYTDRLHRGGHYLTVGGKALGHYRYGTVSDLYLIVESRHD